MQRDELSEQLKQAQDAFIEAQVALQSDVSAQREKTLREQITALDAELKDLREREARIAEALSKEGADALRLCKLLVGDRVEAPPALVEFAQTPDSAQRRMNGLQALISAMLSLGNQYAAREALLGEQTRALRSEAAQLHEEIRQLRAGERKTSYEREAPEAARLQRLLRAEPRLSATEPSFLCTTLHVPDEAWQDAVEGVLGPQRFTLLVAPERYAEAAAVYRAQRHIENLHGVGVIDAEKIIRAVGLPRRGLASALSAEVKTERPAARAFVDLVLGGYVKCDTLDAMREHRTAVTRECFVRRNYSTSHLNPRVYRRWFIGVRALPRQIEQR